MCGIVGVFNHSGLAEGFCEVDVMKKMVASLENRGPDDSAILQSSLALLGHTRLSIVDLATGQQPMVSEDEKTLLTFNGEIFNYVELREELIQQGVNFRTTSDTEVVLQLYKVHGPSFLTKLNGQFAIAIVDLNKKSLLLARDRVGILPLFYSIKGDDVFFSSSIKTLNIHPEFSRKFNFKAYNQLIHLWTTIGDTTFYEDISIVQPGEFLEIDLNGVKKKSYWDLSFEEKPEERSLEEWKEMTSEALNEAVRIRLRADVPVNSYLSGGLDSSILLQLIKENHKNNIESFSVRFSDKGFDESSYQTLMSEHTEIKNNHVTVNPEVIGEVFEDVIFHSEQPVYRTAPSPLFYLSKLVRENDYKVVLSGEGADEISYGYDIFKETLIRYNLSTGNNTEHWLSNVEKLYPYLTQYNKRYLKFLQGFYQKHSGDTDNDLYSHEIRISNGKYVFNFLTPEVKEQLEQHDFRAEFKEHLPHDFSNWTPLQKNQYVEMKTLLAGYLLSSQGDRMSMAHSIEVRFPFLDNNVIDLFAKMPDEVKMNDLNEKHILKETFKNRLPNEITNRNKQPYRAPESLSLLSGELENKYLNEATIKEQGFFNWDLVLKLKNKILSDPENVTFNDNYAMVNIVSTTIFNEQSKTNFDVSGAGENVKVKVLAEA